MADRSIVTIVTESFLPYAKALRAALLSLCEDINFQAVVVDASSEHHLPGWVITPQSLGAELPQAKQIIEQLTEQGNQDQLRWALKSQLMLWAIQRGAKRVLWCDPDLMFFECPQFIFDLIEPKTVLLSPHYRAIRPSADRSNFQKNYTEGLFQAGFLGVGCEATEFLNWWAEACLWNMSKDAGNGTYVDQKFLDLVPVLWEDTVILRHRGCNLAEWNRHENTRESVGNRVLIRGQDPVVFIHFTDCTIAEILCGDDQLLRPYLDLYVDRMREFDDGFELRIPLHLKAMHGGQMPDVAAAPKTRVWQKVRRRVGQLLSS